MKLRGDEWIVRVKRPRPDLGYPEGMLLVAGHGEPPHPDAIVVVRHGAEHVLHRQPVSDGEVVGFILGRLDDEEGVDAA